MAQTEAPNLQVLIVGRDQNGFFTDQAAEAAAAAGWEALRFNEPSQAASHMVGGEHPLPAAVVTELGYDFSALEMGGSSVTPLVDVAGELDVPIGLLSGHPAASWLLKRQPRHELDAVLDKGEDVPPMVTTWLGQVAAAKAQEQGPEV